MNYEMIITTTMCASLIVNADEEHWKCGKKENEIAFATEIAFSHFYYIFVLNLFPALTSHTIAFHHHFHKTE